jgi:hypothetical protein
MSYLRYLFLFAYGGVHFDWQTAHFDVNLGNIIVDIQFSARDAFLA